MHTAGSLQELALVTGIVCNAGLVEAGILNNETQLLEDQLALKGPLTRIQRLMVALLPRYCSVDNWDKVGSDVFGSIPHPSPCPVSFFFFRFPFNFFLHVCLLLSFPCAHL